MNLKARRNHSADFLFPIILFFIFALMALLVMLLSANVYGKITNSSSINYTAHTSVAYISQKVRSCDNGGNIHIGELEGSPCLIIDQEYADSDYCTYIYSYDGSLMELFARADAEARPDSGQRLLDISSLEISYADNDLLEVSCTDTDGNVSDMLISIHTVQ